MPLIVRLNGNHTTNASSSLQITKAAADAAAALGLSVEAVLRKARAAAVLTHSYANYRYEDLMFYIHKDTLYGVWKYVPDTGKGLPPYAVDTGEPVRFVDARRRREISVRGITYSGDTVTGPCPLCEGQGCAECGEKGWVRRSRAEYEELQSLTQLT